MSLDALSFIELIIVSISLTLMILGDYVVVPDGVDTFACKKSLLTCKLPDTIEFLYLDNNRLKISNCHKI